MDRNAKNDNFKFLNPNELYHAYYQHCLSESVPSVADYDGTEAAPKPDIAAQFRLASRKVLEPPEAEQYTVWLPEGITGEERDIIKRTAQFVARNGQTFLTGLTNREMNNPQFDFMNPTHILFTFFTGLADAYLKVLMLPKGLTEKLTNSVSDMTTVLERCLHRIEWERSQEQARQRAEDEIEQERLQMAMIDWHDFVVVETIAFADDEDDELPVPMPVIRGSKVTAVEEGEIVEPGGKEVEMEMDEDQEVKLVEQAIRTVKKWKRPEERLLPAERDPTKFVVSPITGEVIPINEMSEHMRISLIDPKYKEQKERMFAKIRETTIAADDEISKNIPRLAQTRHDIFGTTEEEVSNALQAEIQKKKDEQPKQQVIWDGHTGSIGRTANQAMSQSLGDHDQNRSCMGGGHPVPLPRPPGMPLMPSIRPSNMPAEPPPPGSQFSPMPVHRPFAAVPIMSMPPPHTHAMAPPTPLPQAVPPPPPPEEPEAKRQKLDDSMLIPEEQFLTQHPGPASINITVPSVDEGNLRGQVLDIRVEGNL